MSAGTIIVRAVRHGGPPCVEILEGRPGALGRRVRIPAGAVLDVCSMLIEAHATLAGLGAVDPLAKASPWGSKPA